jgi:prepilin-type N-terminal cleavage/methylation domain-containing protein
MQIVNRQKKSTQDGFTLIELLMVILVIAILAFIGITQFVNYGKDARDATTKANLQILRRAISEKAAMMRVRCNVQDNSFPTATEISANDITNTSCTVGQVPGLADRIFVAGGIPPNPWSTDIQTTPANAILITDCQLTPATCADRTGACHTVAKGNGWCYNSVTGEIWAHSSNNDPTGAADDEHTY